MAIDEVVAQEVQHGRGDVEGRLRGKQLVGRVYRLAATRSSAARYRDHSSNRRQQVNTLFRSTNGHYQGVARLLID